MGRTVVVSNRVAWPGPQRPGGLAIALKAALREDAGLWFGWSGRSGERDAPPHRCREHGVDYCTIDLPRADVEAYYRDFANRVLWPLLHSRLDLVDYGRECSAGYRRVNARLAARLARELRSDDLVWVHDYHLIPLARELRRLGVDNRIGFFLHVPFPPADLIATLPAHAAVFGELAAYDLIGLQTQQDAEHASDYLRRHADLAPCGPGLWRDGDRRLRIAALPIGIDTPAIAAQAAASDACAEVARLRASLDGRRLAIGVDRLDYSKGLPERLRGFERYLERALARQRRRQDELTYLQIATPSRGDVPEYQRLRQALDSLAGHVNGVHARPDWTPVRYVNHDFPHALLAGFYRQAAIALVTPLRDGMNLVAKEYVACQSPQDPGVLVLSRFAGAACELEQALLVNPHDPDEIAEAIQCAADMGAQERRERWRAMMQTLRRNDVTAWRRAFLDQLRAVPTTAQPAPARLRAAAAGPAPRPDARGVRPAWAGLAPWSGPT